jgi:hypothetical protein
MTRAALAVVLSLLTACAPGSADRGVMRDDTAAAPVWAAPTGTRVDSLVPRSDGDTAMTAMTARVLARLESLPPSPVPGEVRSRMVFTDGASGIIPIGLAAPVFTFAPTESRASYELVQGVECGECDAPTMIWVFRGVPGEVRQRGLALPFPGTHSEPGAQDVVPVVRHRLFVGACLDRGPVVAIWLTETLQAPMTRSLTVLQASDALYLDRASWSDDTVRALEADVARGGCREVPGMDQTIL